MVNVGSVKVGLIAVDEIFKKLYEAGKKPEEIKRKELIRELSIYNYIITYLSGSEGVCRGANRRI